MVNKSHQKSNRGIEEEKRAVSKLTGGQGRPFFLSVKQVERSGAVELETRFKLLAKVE